MTETTCPHCGKVHKYCTNCGGELGRSGGMLAPAPGGRWSTMRPMQSSAPAPWQASPAAPTGAYTAIRKTPARSPSVAADVATPIGKGLAVGIAAGTMAILPAVLLDGWPWYTPLLTMATAAPLAVVGFIFHHQSHLWSFEEITQSDGQPKAPQASPPVSLEVVQTNDAGTFEKMFRFDLPVGVTEQKFYELAKGATEGRRGLSLSDWTGRGRPFSRKEYEQLIGELQAAGLVAFVNPTAPAQGRKLTAAGRKALLTFTARYEAK